MKSHNILKFSRNSIVSLRCSAGLLKKKQFCENPILNTMVTVSV